MKREALSTRLAIGSGVVLTTLVLAGCGGGGGSGITPAPMVTPTPTPVAGVQPAKIFAAPKALNGGTVRGYVTLQGQVPTAVGVELDDQAVTNTPTLPFGQPQTTFGIPLPAQASVTPFKEIAIAYFTAHAPVGVGDKPHFHPLFLLNSPAAPDPPAFALENKAIAPAELPADHVVLGDVAPGIGVAVQDPAQPQAQPGWDSIGQNYFFYNGHMNAIALGATKAYLLRLHAETDIARGGFIKQPQVYPKSGYYPHIFTVHFDNIRQVFVFELTDFRHV